MKFNEYQMGVLQTWNHGIDITLQKCNASMGLAGEVGELIDLLKKSLFHGVPADHDKIQKEMGDVQYYLTVLAHLYGLDLEDIAVANHAKLKARYPDGFVKGGGNR